VFLFIENQSKTLIEKQSQTEQLKWYKLRPLKEIIPEHFDHFCASLVLVIFFPLLPLLLELVFFSAISLTSLFLSAAIYSVSIGVSSGFKTLFAISIAVSFIFSASFGFAIVTPGKIPAIVPTSAYVAIAFIVLTHSVERWEKHFVNKKKFWDA